MADTIVDVHGLSKQYRKSDPPAVIDFELKLAAGEVFGFVGPNGAGKTTTIKMLLNLIYPDSGGGTIFGYDIVKQSLEVRRRLAYMDGDTPLYQNMRGREFIDFINSLFPAPNPERLKRLADIFEVPLDRKIKSYSAGQKQQTALIAALGHDSNLLLMDEPTKGLDPSKKKLFLEAIAERASDGAAVIISSHVLSEIEAICDRVSFIKDGRLLADEDIEAAREKLHNKIFVSFEEDFRLDEDLLHGVSVARSRGGSYILTVEVNPRQIIRQLSEMPITSLRYRRASLDDLYTSLYLDEQNEVEVLQ